MISKLKVKNATIDVESLDDMNKPKRIHQRAFGSARRRRGEIRRYDDAGCFGNFLSKGPKGIDHGLFGG